MRMSHLRPRLKPEASPFLGKVKAHAFRTAHRAQAGSGPRNGVSGVTRPFPLFPPPGSFFPRPVRRVFLTVLSQRDSPALPAHFTLLPDTILQVHTHLYEILWTRYVSEFRTTQITERSGTKYHLTKPPPVSRD